MKIKVINFSLNKIAYLHLKTSFHVRRIVIFFHHTSKPLVEKSNLFKKILSAGKIIVFSIIVVTSVSILK